MKDFKCDFCENTKCKLIKSEYPQGGEQIIAECTKCLLRIDITDKKDTEEKNDSEVLELQ